jgi:hypothetical protein
MKTKEELQEMFDSISDAKAKYRDAVEDNLKENCKEYELEDDMESEDEEDEYYYKGVHINIEGRHGDLVLMQIDKIRLNKKRGVNGLVEAHICAENFKERDYWMLVCNFEDDIDYIYSSIIW